MVESSIFAGSFLADNYSHVYAVEQNRTALDFARKNIPENKSVFVNLSVEHMEGDEFPEPAELIVVNPPRIGLTRNARQFTISQDADRIIYVSCNPVTQARDLRAFLEADYVIYENRLFDLYPQTAHVESVVKLQKQ